MRSTRHESNSQDGQYSEADQFSEECKVDVIEDLHNEFKESWADKYLRNIAAFANTDGGTLYIGVDDIGNIVGVEDYRRLLKMLPDKIESSLRIVPVVSHHEVAGMVYLTVEVEKSPELLFLDGKIYGKSGSATRELKGHNLRARALKRGMAPWTEEPSNLSLDDLNNAIYLDFIRMARDKGMLSEDEENMTIDQIFQKLELMVDGHPKMGAALLFHPQPQMFSQGAYVQIGKFEGPNILFQDLVEGPLLHMPNKVMGLLFSKYMIAPISFEGIYRTQKYPYPDTAVREAVLNLLMHSDYGDDVSIQIKVYPDRMEMWNRGSPPDGWTVDTLMSPHESVPGNPSIAAVFHRAGMVEKFGRGIETIMSCYEGRDVRKPEFKFTESEFCVVFYDENFSEEGKKASVPFTESGDESDIVTQYGLKGIESAIYSLILNSKFTTYPEMALKLNVSSKTVERAVEELRKKNLIARQGSRKTGVWVARKDLER